MDLMIAVMVTLFALYFYVNNNNIIYRPTPLKCKGLVTLYTQLRGDNTVYKMYPHVLIHRSAVR